MSYIDKYYHSLKKNHDVRDCSLTVYTALLIASKAYEVEPLSLRDVRDHFLRDTGHQRPHIVVREKEIFHACSCESESTDLFGVMMFYMRLWKL